MEMETFRTETKYGLNISILGMSMSGLYHKMSEIGESMSQKTMYGERISRLRMLGGMDAWVCEGGKIKKEGLPV